MAGAVSDLDPGDGPFLILDIGGGSTELVAGSGPDDPALAAVSMQIGCVRVTERFLDSDPPSPDELGRAESMVAELLDAAIADEPRLRRRHAGWSGWPVRSPRWHPCRWDWTTTTATVSTTRC